ncbi:MAG: outer membrane lipoprotein carrier protein LolA [Acidobacteriota bacterium]
MSERFAVWNPVFRVAATLWLCAAASLPLVAADLPDPEAEGLSLQERTEALLERVKVQQADLETLTADFVQRQESELFLEPETSTGRFWFRAPDRVRWDFETPEKSTIVVDGETMTTWYRDLDRAERIDIGDQAEQVTEYLSGPSSLETLERYFDLRVRFPADASAPYKLDLTPRFERVEKRIEKLQIHVARETFQVVYLRYVEPGGDVTEYSFENVVINPSIDDGRFALELPDSLEVRELTLREKREQSGD